MAAARELKNLAINGNTALTTGYRAKGQRSYFYKGVRYEHDESAEAYQWEAEGAAPERLPRGFYRVEAVIGERVTNGQPEFLVKWADFAADTDATWLPLSECSPADVTAWHAEQAALNDIEMDVDDEESKATPPFAVPAVVESEDHDEFAECHDLDTLVKKHDDAELCEGTSHPGLIKHTCQGCRAATIAMLGAAEQEAAAYGALAFLCDECGEAYLIDSPDC